MINQKTFDLINKIGGELFQKTKISTYVLLQNESFSREERRQYLKQVSQNLHSPFALIYFFKQDKKINFLFTQDLEDLVDADEIYKDYIVPFLPVKKSDILDQSRISTIVLNGYIHLVDTLADIKGVKISSNIVDKQGEALAKVATIAIKVMLFILLAFIVWFYIIRRKR
ncbi:hypothetical protein [Helicobacter sp. 'CLO3_human']|uniref:hypothetical protein n=1 Tax=Helicobacter sp. 'CLO3_human' TaxID=2020249 RepID=UPI0013156186|nr:hypothetical protein [Helicobacter sp. 'CLO3_human']